MTKILSLALVLILAGCAVGRSYQKADNMWSLGYSDTQLNERVYRVSYAGYGIPQNECDDFALMRAADIAKEKGYKSFRLLNEQQSSHTQAIYIPGQTYTTGTVSSSGHVNATSFSTAYATSVNYPVSTITVEMLNEKDTSNAAFDVETIWNSLAKKYGVSK